MKVYLVAEFDVEPRARLTRERAAGLLAVGLASRLRGEIVDAAVDSYRVSLRLRSGYVVDAWIHYCPSAGSCRVLARVYRETSDPASDYQALLSTAESVRRAVEEALSASGGGSG